MKQTLRPFSARFGLLFLFFFLLNASAHSQLGRFHSVTWKVKPWRGLSTFFNVTGYLIDRRGDTVVVEPGKDIVRWDYFKFHSEPGVKCNYGLGTFPIYRDFNGPGFEQ